MMEFCETDDELAIIMAHEITHCLLNHGVCHETSHPFIEM